MSLYLHSSQYEGQIWRLEREVRGSEAGMIGGEEGGCNCPLATQSDRYVDAMWRYDTPHDTAVSWIYQITTYIRRYIWGRYVCMLTMGEEGQGVAAAPPPNRSNTWHDENWSTCRSSVRGEMASPLPITRQEIA